MSAAKMSLAESLSKAPTYNSFYTWIVGDTPLITHAWSEKARREMLSKQVKATKPGREARKPEEDYIASMYDMGDNVCGFPAMGVKNCILSNAHKDKGIPRSMVQAALWLDAEMVRTRPALAGAICDMPLLRIYGTAPEMREDPVKVGSGLNKTSTLAYRAQFTTWAMKLTGQFDNTALTLEQLATLLMGGGKSEGLGEWRPGRRGMFGTFHVATVAEEKAWDSFATGKTKTVPAARAAV